MSKFDRTGITYRFSDNSCARTACKNPANSGCKNLATGWFYCRHCADRIRNENDSGPSFMLIEAGGSDAYETPPPSPPAPIPSPPEILDALLRDLQISPEVREVLLQSDLPLSDEALTTLREDLGGMRVPEEKLTTTTVTVTPTKKEDS